MKQFRTLAVAALAVTAMTAVSPAVALADTTVVQPQPVAVTTVAAGATTTIVDTNPATGTAGCAATWVSTVTDW